MFDCLIFVAHLAKERVSFCQHLVVHALSIAMKW